MIVAALAGLIIFNSNKNKQDKNRVDVGSAAYTVDYAWNDADYSVYGDNNEYVPEQDEFIEL